MVTSIPMELGTGANNNNTSDDDDLNGSHIDDRLTAYAEFQRIVLWILFVMIIVGNSIVLTAVYTIRHKKSRVNFFVTHLALADLLVGLTNPGAELVYKYTEGFYGGDIMCKLIRYLQAYAVYASSFQLVALSLDRFFAIVFPMDFSGSGKRSKIMAASAWSLPLFLSITSAIVFKIVEIKQSSDDPVLPHCVPPALVPGTWPYKAYTMYVVFGFFYIPLIVIAICYIVMIVAIWRRSRYMMGPSSSSGKKKGNGYSKVNASQVRHRASSRGLIPKAKVKTIKMTVCIVLAYIVCWCPFSLYYTLDAFHVIKPHSQASFAVTIIQNLPSLNSAVNPFIYGIFSTNICKELRRFSVVNWLAAHLPCCEPYQTRQFGMPSSTMRTDTHVTEFNLSDGAGGRGGKIYTPGRLVQVSDAHSRSDTSNERTATTAM
ncbi:neuropeptide S receptor-like [Amphiura filiformis]|uniref:neuropeptide S receptor-like n=1 Tax=Amphiura filiformis TaxID=82378 RepID=UPI003B217B1E